MECTQNENYACDNEDMLKCKNCVAPMLCFCTRPEIVKNRNKLWEKASKEEVENDDKS